MATISEATVLTKTGTPVRIIQEETDPMCIRVSMGGNEKVGYYLMFRGDPQEVRQMISEVRAAFIRQDESISAIKLVIKSKL